MVGEDWLGNKTADEMLDHDCATGRCTNGFIEALLFKELRLRIGPLYKPQVHPLSIHPPTRTNSNQGAFREPGRGVVLSEQQAGWSSIEQFADL